MLYMVKATLSQPAGLGNKEFYGIWLEEADAALAAREAGIVKALWKVAGSPVVLILVEMESHDMIDRVMLSMPMWAQGYSHVIDVEWTPLRAYEEWHEDLVHLAGG